ncbi:uncharacterized protein [Ptychodera flava]|uniref:uncharacterized protein n=1 Tax=Ptychodera flava TaxID=63121 RepID=UPI003969C61A
MMALHHSMRISKSCFNPAITRWTSIAVSQRQLAIESYRSIGRKSIIEIKALKESHRADAVESLTDVFWRHSPMLKHLGASYECVKHLKEIAVNRSIHDGVGTIAIDTEKNKIAGVLTAFLKTHERDGSEDYGDSHLLRPVMPYLDLVAVLRARFYQLDEVKTEQSRGSMFLEIYQVGVGDDYHGHDLTPRMTFNSFKRGKLKGAKFAYSEMTNPITHNIAARMPHVVQIGDMIKYAAFDVDGQKPLADMQAECRGAIIVMTKL